MFNDPVCGLFVDDDSPYTSHYGGRDYTFCSGICKETFDQAPDKYASPDAAQSRMNGNDLGVESL
jgi:YHS domain-containing protein